MYVKKIVYENEFKLWLKELNRSFKCRSTENIPYEKITKEDIRMDKNDIIIGVYNDIGDLLGGACISYCMEYRDIKTARISRVWTSVNYQNRGVGKFLMEEIEKRALQRGVELIQLNVANIYFPAVHLYEKSGFKKLKIYANIPHTYYFVRMIKAIGKYNFPERKRIYELIKSTIIFKTLYKKDSSPTLVNKIIYNCMK